jgi:hypothetical protein
MEGNALLQLPDGMHVGQIQIIENGLVIGSSLLPSRPVVRCALNHHHRSIAIIAGPCVMRLVRAVVSSFAFVFASSPVATPTASVKSSQSVCQPLWNRGPG